MSTDTAISTSKLRRRRLVIVGVVVAIVLGGTAGGVAWFNADQASQEQARADEAQQEIATDAAAAEAAKKAASDAYWAKANAAEQQRKADTAAKDAAVRADDIAAKGWRKVATDIYTADNPGGYQCTRLACSKFLVMTTASNGCPRGIVIRGRWLQGGVVTGPVTEVTGPLRSGEQAAVEVLDYTGTADSLDLTEYRCT